MKKLYKTTLVLLCLAPLVGVTGCQTLGLYKFGIGTKEINYIEEEHRASCQQPVGKAIPQDRCGRLIYGDGSKH
jgi:hypothetical protein